MWRSLPFYFSNGKSVNQLVSVHHLAQFSFQNNSMTACRSDMNKSSTTSLHALKQPTTQCAHLQRFNCKQHFYLCIRDPREMRGKQSWLVNAVETQCRRSWWCWGHLYSEPTLHRWKPLIRRKKWRCGCLSGRVTTLSAYQSSSSSSIHRCLNQGQRWAVTLTYSYLRLLISACYHLLQVLKSVQNKTWSTFPRAAIIKHCSTTLVKPINHQASRHVNQLAASLRCSFSRHFSEITGAVQPGAKTRGRKVFSQS